MQVDQVLENALGIFNCSRDELLHDCGRHLTAHKFVRGPAHVTVIVDSAVPALRAGLLMLFIEHGAFVGRLVFQDIAHVDEACVFVCKTLAIHVQIQERFLPHQSGIEIVHHLRVAQVLHLGAGAHGQDVAVTGLAILLFIEEVDIRTPMFYHRRVVRIVAGREDHRLRGVEAYVFSVFILTDHADDLTVQCDQLHRGCREKCLEIRMLFFHMIQNVFESIAHVQRLGTYPRSPEIAVVVPVFVTVFAVFPRTREVAAGADERAEFVAVVQEFRAFRVAVDFAAVAVLGLDREAAAVPEPHHGFLRVVGVGTELLYVRAPVAQAVGVVDPFGDAGLRGAGFDDRGSAVALRYDNSFFLKQGCLRA